jgi:hypothetical protein
MKTNWFNVSMIVAMAVQKVQEVMKAPGTTKQQKAIEIIDASIMAGSMLGIDKGVLSLPEVQTAKKAAIDALVAFENVIAAAQGKLHPTT